MTRPQDDHTLSIDRQTQRQRDGVLLDRVDENQGVEVVVVGPQELEQAGGEEARLHQRQQNLPEHAEGAAAVNVGGLVQIAGNAAHKLNQLVDEEGVAGQNGGHPPRHIGIDPAELG